MYQIEVDTHTHTIATTHAYSTVTELCTHAGKVGLKGICITDHGPGVEGGMPHPYHFVNLNILPRVLGGVRLIRGAELNLCDYQGTLDLQESDMKALEWVIAGIHTPCLKPGTPEQITEAYLGALANPRVDCLGHIGQPKFMCHYEPIVREAKKLDKIIEINNNSVNVRPGSFENCIAIAKLCKQYGVQVCVSTDCHFHEQLGKWERAFSILEAAEFPEELIVNRNIQVFRDYILKRRNVDILAD